MFDVVTELFIGFGLNQYPQTLSELIPWLLSVFIGVTLVLHIMNCIFILTKAFIRQGGGS